jgi:ribosomal protein S17E
MKLTAIQKQQLKEKGIAQETLEKQLYRFENGFPGVTLNRAATLNDGIVPIDQLDQPELIASYESARNQLDIIKFVPASGAATRMFKFLHEFLNNFNHNKESINSYINNNKANDLFTFLIGRRDLPFYSEVLASVKKKNPDWNSKSKTEKETIFVREVLTPSGFNYAAMPKGLVPFHKYKDHSATAFEEHLFEASIYSSSNGIARLHFTIAPAFKDHFTAEFERIKKIVEKKTQTQFDISFSYQSPATDTLAVDMENQPIVFEDGTLFFRPAGHGALIDNLNQLDADVIFIKNIDNVTISSLEKETTYYKKLLAGYLLHLRTKTFDYLEVLEKDHVDESTKEEIEKFLTEELAAVLPKDYHKYKTRYQLEHLHDQLNRPLRVCGMVKNEGEPGGGPFWVRNQRGELSIEIVESAQMDKSDPRQKKIAKSATHFNPVDLICNVRDHKGKKYDLAEYCDEDTGFITYKSRQGKEIKAQELPGLWNGGMAYWNSVFVEVPLITFNPVKTVNDLLKAAHQLEE